MTDVSIPILCFLTCTEQLREVRVTLPCTKRSCKRRDCWTLSPTTGSSCRQCDPRAFNHTSTHMDINMDIHQYVHTCITQHTYTPLYTQTMHAHTQTHARTCAHTYTHTYILLFLSSQRHFCHLKNTFALSGQTLSQEALMFMTSNLFPAFADRNFSTNTQCIPHVCPLMGKEACSQDHHCLSSTVPPA